MKFTSYYVHFDHQEASFQGRIFLEPNDYSTTFNRVDENIYILQFASQVSLRLGQTFSFKKTGQNGTILLPQHNKYNQRKQQKLMTFLKDWDRTDPFSVLTVLLDIENFLEIETVRHFFNLTHQGALDWVIGEVFADRLFLMDTQSLMVCTRETVTLFAQRVEEQIKAAHTGVVNTLRFPDIEEAAKLPADSRLFRYLLAVFQPKYAYTLMKDSLVLGKNELSDSDRSSAKDLQALLKKHKMIVFSLDDLIETKTLPHKKLNDMLWAMVEKDDVVRLNDRFFIFQEDLAKILNRLKKHKRNVSDEIDIKTFREMTQLTRKYIITLFEYFDAQNITRRVEDHRQILLTV
jgi:hypothetical protein